jgi:tRNA A37 threonylcarbamoyltransferase TsaD
LFVTIGIIGINRKSYGILHFLPFQDVDKFLILGSTLDDSPGEALDKIARRLQVDNYAPVLVP